MTENQRLKVIRGYLAFTQSQLAERVGLKQGSYADVERGKVKVSGDIKRKLEKEFSINVTWLETGVGNMIIEESINSFKETPRRAAQNARLIGDLNETEFEDGSRFRQIGPDMWAMNVEIVTERAKAGWLRGFADTEYHEVLPTVEVIVDFVAKGQYLAFEVDGDSMDDGTIQCIPHKTVIVGRELASHKWSPRLYNHEWPNWIFIHKRDGILVKQIADQNLEEGWITHHSLNPNKELYPDERIEIKDIVKIYNVVKRILP